MRKIASQILFCLFFAVVIFGQTKKTKTEIIDEFGQIGLDELLARLDGFRSVLDRDINLTASVKIYGGENVKYFAFPYVRKAYIKAYIAQYSNPNVNRFVFENCKSTEPEIRIQLLAIPSGVKIEKCEENFSVPQKTVYFGGGYDYEPNPYEQIEGCCDVEGSEKFIAEESQKVLLRLLQSSPESKIYIIGYAGRFSWEVFKENKKGEIITEQKKKIDSLIIGNKIAERTKKMIVQKGVKPSRIIVINGGYNDNYRQAAIYFVPKGGEIPKPKPDYFPKKKRNKI